MEEKMANKYNNSNQSENKYNSYIANDIIGGGLEIVLRSQIGRAHV